jgi:hypothetical protein
MMKGWRERLERERDRKEKEKPPVVVHVCMYVW